MLTLKKFIFCIDLGTGCVLISVYCSLTNVAYIAAFVHLYQFVRITKLAKDMYAIDKLKALGISVCINFMIYHIIASLLVIIAVKKRKYQAILYYLKFHIFITIFCIFGGLIYLNSFPEILLISIFLFDMIARAYSLVVVESLHQKLKSADKENELMNMQDMSKLSYGAIDDAKSTPSHHVTFTLESSRDSLNTNDDFGDELRNIE